MTISNSPSDPLFVVLGATGNQGGSVVRAIQQSALRYRVRAVTRDPSKPAAKALVEQFGSVVLAQADVTDARSLEEAFRGADVVFGMTLSGFGTPNAQVKELEDGKRVVDVAHSAGVKKFAFSGLSSVKDMSNGRLDAWNFEVKSDIIKYARSKSPSWEVYDIQPAFFASNFLLHNAPRPSPANDGTYTLALTVNADTELHVIDVPSDYGRHVLGAIEKGVKVVHTGTEITPVEIAKAFEEVSGKTVRFWQMPDEMLHEILSKNMSPLTADVMVRMYQVVREIGCYGDQDLTQSRETLIGGPPKTFVEFLREHKEEVHKILV